MVRVEASPINPSDLGVLIPGADMSAATVAGTPEHPIVTAPLPDGALAGLSARVGTSLPVGNEGAGTVVAAGGFTGRPGAPRQERWDRRRPAMYSQYRVVNAPACLVLPDGATAKHGASSFVNPLTALGMLETMRREGHSALVHTAAASNLGQMLVKLCIADGVRLSTSSASPTKRSAEIAWRRACLQFGFAVVRDRSRRGSDATSATLAFDATGGGTLASQILTAWSRRPSRPRRRTPATARPCTSRSTSTAGSTPARPRSPGTSAWRGVSAGGC